MIVKGIIDEDFINYKKPSMVIEFPYCSFKCDKECNQQVCQNSALVKEQDIEISVKKIVNRYLNNPITKAIVCQGLEPFDSVHDLFLLISALREKTDDDIIIYTGYNKTEIEKHLHFFSKFSNIIIKFGRFIPNQPSHFDEVLGVTLASPNQYAERL